MMKKLFVFTLMAILMMSFAVAKSSNTNEGFNFECQNFYDGNPNYYTIAKFSYDSGEDYALDEENKIYNYFNIDVQGDLHDATWTSNPEVASVLVKAGSERIEFDGGSSGEVSSTKEISHITFCGYRNGNGGCVGDDCGSNGVPVFPGLAAGVAILVVTLGLIFIRRN